MSNKLQQFQKQASNFVVPPVEPLSVWDWVFLIVALILGISATLLGGYCTYMNEHGKSLIFNAVIEDQLLSPEQRKKKKERLKAEKERERKEDEREPWKSDQETTSVSETENTV